MSQATNGPLLSRELLAAVLERLDLQEPISVDLEGLTKVLQAFVFNVPLDNLRKRIWFAGDQEGPLPGGDPIDFFENWLRHGTGGTCWPLHGGFRALLRTLGFPARQIAGALLMGPGGMTDEYDHDSNHTTVIVEFDGVEYLTDCNMGCVAPLPLNPHEATKAGWGIHEIEARPFDGWVEVRFWPQVNREQQVIYRPLRKYDPVKHDFALAEYDRTRHLSVFNKALLACYRHPDRILSVGRSNKILIDADANVTKTPITDDERARILVEDFGYSQEIVDMLPPDEDGSETFV